VSDKGSVPDQWLPLFNKRQITSYRELGRLARIDYTRARRVILGGGTTDDAVEAVASALGVTPSKVWELRGEPVPNPFTLPAAAGSLNRKEREAVLAVINAILDAKVQPVEPRAAKQSDYDLASGNRNVGTQSEGRRRRQAQDEAAEHPDE
jgi:hypothetical protein